MSAYKPGTVAVATVRHVSDVRVFRTDDPARPWVTVDCEHRRDSEVTDVRPLVAIELPKGALAGWPVLIDALRKAREATGYLMTFDGLIDQIEAQTRPSEPAEPTNPKVRVTDRRDNIWRLLADGDWVCTSGPDVGEYLTWSRLAAERGPLEVDDQ